MRRRAVYRYNGANRMVYSEVARHGHRSRVGSVYAYDALGRRMLVQDGGSAAMRTLCNGTGFETVREGVTFSDGRFTTRYSEGVQALANPGTEGSRYRWVGDVSAEARTRVIGDGEYAEGRGRYTGAGVTLYGRGEAVAVNRVDLWGLSVADEANELGLKAHDAIVSFVINQACHSDG
jgi:hypothetical protein